MIFILLGIMAVLLVVLSVELAILFRKRDFFDDQAEEIKESIEG